MSTFDCHLSVATQLTTGGVKHYISAGQVGEKDTECNGNKQKRFKFEFDSKHKKEDSTANHNDIFYVKSCKT